MMMSENRPLRKSLCSLLLVNWSKFGAQHIHVEGSVLFTGVNGSGKSTLLDAMMYVITGNTTFNVAAQDRDRTVLSYVRGDTRSKGAYRYLRNGEVVSYIAMEFDSPMDNGTFVAGVCIESRDEQDQKSLWFVRNHVSINDFNFYQKNGTKLSVTPRQFLCCKGEKLKTQDFLKKEQGIRQIMRMMGLRGIDMREYQSKLLKMLAFKPGNHIDHFIRDCVLQEHKIETIPQLQEQKLKYDELLEFYKGLLKQKEQLEVLERATVQYETSRRNVWLKWMVYYYQNWQIAQKKSEKLRKQQISAGEMFSRYEAAEQSVKIAMDQASQVRGAAKTQYDDNDLTGSIRSLKEQVEKLNEQINSCEEKQKAVQTLQEQINSLLLNPLLGITPSDEAVAKGFTDSGIGAEDKYRELQDIQAKVNVQKNAFSRKEWEFEDELQKLEEKLAAIERDIQGLENHQRAYPEYVESARRILKRELSAQGIDTPVRTLAELVEDISLPQWNRIQI